MNNPIISGYPQTVRVGDVEKPVVTYFRVWLQIARALSDTKLSDLEKLNTMLHLSQLEASGDPAADFSALCWFMRAGDESRATGKAIRAFDYDIDAGLIIASFYSDYKIDITSPDVRMHWWLFQDLFRGLSYDSPIMRVIKLRQAEPPSGNDPETRKQRETLLAAKKRYALPARTRDEIDARDRAIWGD